MTRTSFLVGAVSVVVTAASWTAAAEPTPLKPRLLKPEKLVVDESFSSGKLPDNWRVAKGSWEVVDGRLVGREKPADEHAGVLNLQVPNRDSAIEFSFRLEGARAFHLSFNKSKGHLFRVILTPQSVVVRTDIDKKDPQSKPVVLGRAETSLKAGQRHTMLVELRGDEVLVQLDNGVSIHGQHESLATDKPNYRFIIQGEAVEIDDVKIWQSRS